MNCLKCKVGWCEISGCHYYCNKCDFTAFVVNNDYIAAAGAYFGGVYSNTKFTSKQVYVEVLYAAIEDHLPILSQGLRNIKEGKEAILSELAELTLANAINLEIVGLEEEELLMTKDTFNCVNCSSIYYDVLQSTNINCRNCLTLYSVDEHTNEVTLFGGDARG